MQKKYVEYGRPKALKTYELAEAIINLGNQSSLSASEIRKILDSVGGISAGGGAGVYGGGTGGSSDMSIASLPGQTIWYTSNSTNASP